MTFSGFIPVLVGLPIIPLFSWLSAGTPALHVPLKCIIDGRVFIPITYSSLENAGDNPGDILPFKGEFCLDLFDESEYTLVSGEFYILESNISWWLYCSLSIVSAFYILRLNLPISWEFYFYLSIIAFSGEYYFY